MPSIYIHRKVPRRTWQGSIHIVRHLRQEAHWMHETFACWNRMKNSTDTSTLIWGVWALSSYPTDLPRKQMRGKQDLGKSRVREKTMRQVVGAALSVRCQCTGKKGFTSYIVWSVQGRVWVGHEHQLMQLGSGSYQELLLGCNENTCHRAEELRSKQEELEVQKEKHLFFLSYYQTKKKRWKAQDGMFYLIDCLNSS